MCDDEIYKDVFDSFQSYEIKEKRTGTYVNNNGYSLLHDEKEDLVIDDDEIKRLIEIAVKNLENFGNCSKTVIIEALNLISDDSSPIFLKIIEELSNYDITNILLSLAHSEDHEIYLRSIIALSVYLLNSPNLITDNVFDFCYEKLFKCSQEEDELFILFTFFTNILNRNTILHFSQDFCEKMFNLVTNTRNLDLLSHFISFVFKFFNVLLEIKEEECSHEIIIVFLGFFINFITSNPIEYCKKEKALILDFVVENFSDNKKLQIIEIIKKAIPTLNGMGSDVYCYLFHILCFFPCDSEYIKLCAQSLFDSIISCFPHDCYTQGIALMDMIICKNKGIFLETILEGNAEKLLLLSASFVKQIMKNEARFLIFAGRILCLLIINFPSQFLSYHLWKDTMEDYDGYNLSQPIKKLIEYGNDLLLLAGTAISTLFQRLSIEEPDSIPSFLETMNKNGILSLFNECLESCDDDEEKEALEIILHSLQSGEQQNE